MIDAPALVGRSEPDPEIQDIFKDSHGLNVGLEYLDGVFNFDLAAAGDLVSPEFAARVVWLDALVTNPDRTHRNPGPSATAMPRRVRSRSRRPRSAFAG